MAAHDKFPNSAPFYSVWVGPLPLQCKKETLYEFFGKFGQLKDVVICRGELENCKHFGYVNYFSRDNAECAACVMDGFKLFDETIKTKGPSQLEALKNEQNVGTKMDFRSLTDCLFFIDGRNCTWKTGECLFRHCNKAMKTERVCDDWQQRRCIDVHCPFRHPRMIEDSTINIVATRCPSHNAFKCFGECGNKDCSTHFLEHSAYVEHVKMSKKLSQPFSTCVKCQAVFFNHEEQLNHRCYKSVLTNSHQSKGIPHFTSTRVQAEKDVVHPIPSYPNRLPHPANGSSFHSIVNPQQSKGNKKYPSILSCSKDNQRLSKHSHVLQNHSTYTPASWSSSNNYVSKNQQNLIPVQTYGTKTSTYSCRPKLANGFDYTKNLNIPNSNCGNLAQKMNSGVVQSSPTQVNASKEFEPVGVFWDFENCSVPKGKSARAVVQKIRNVFFKDKREAEFMCVCDTSKEKKSVIEELNKAQVTVVHINATSKNAADDKLRQSLRRFAQTFRLAATVVLISGDGNFAMDLSDLRHRYNFHVICLHNAAASSALLAFAHETYRFDLFTEELHSSTPLQGSQKLPYSSDVYISNLPTNKNPPLLKGRLTKLSENCGGKVIAIDSGNAILRFPNVEAAFRARRRLDKEELYGCTLQATLLPLTSNKNNRGDSVQITAKQKPSASPINENITTSTVNSRMERNSNHPNNSKSWKENQSPNTVKSSPQNVHLPGSPNHPYIADPRPMRAPFANHPFPGQWFRGHVLHPDLLHTMYRIRTGTPPLSALPLATSPSPIPVSPTPLKLLVNSLARRSPSPEQQFNGVDLLVTNLYENAGKDEIKKKLASTFREHCKVYSVVLHVRKGAPLRALVKVPKLLDANVAISKVNGKMFLSQNLVVSLASEKDKELCYLQHEAVTVLQEAPLGWLPIAVFYTNFENKYRRNLDDRHLVEIQDSVVINGSADCQTISLYEGKIDLENVLVDGGTFTSDVSTLLNDFKGTITLVSFPALYWLKYSKHIDICSTGSLLVDVLCRIPNVTVVGEGTERKIQWIEKPRKDVTGMDRSILRSQIVEILQKDHEFETSVKRLQEKYFEMFEKELDPFSYGFHSLSDLLHSLTGVILMKDDPTGNNVELLREYRVQLFKKEIIDLLSQQSHHSVLLTNFMASYVKHFGQKFKVSSFGYNRLTDLIKAVSTIVEIEGSGDQRTVKLVEVECKQHCSTIADKTVRTLPLPIAKDLKTELFTLIDDKEIKLIHVKNIPKIYKDHFHEAFPYEPALLEETLKCLDKPLEVRGSSNDRIVGIFNNLEDDSVSKPDFVFVKSAIEILYKSEEHCLPKANFHRLYLNVLKNENVDENDSRLKCFPSCVVIRKVGFDEFAELRRSSCVRLLVEEIKQLLGATVDLSMSLDELPLMYEKHFKKTFDLKTCGVSSTRDIEDTFCGHFEFKRSEAHVVHVLLSPVSRFEVETQNLLERNGGCMSFSRFAPAYQKMYSKPCILSEYGYTKLSSLIHAIPHVARVVGNGPEKFVVAVQRSIPERVTNDMLGVRIVGGSTEEVFPNDKEKAIISSSTISSNSNEDLCNKVDTSTSSVAAIPLRNSCNDRNFIHNEHPEDSVERIVSSVTSKPHPLGKPKNGIVKSVESTSRLVEKPKLIVEQGGAKNRNTNCGAFLNSRSKSSKTRLAANFSVSLNEKV